MLSEIVRQRIRRLRTERYLTQEALCDRAGISIDAVSRIEGGSRVPTLDTLEKIAHALSVSVVDLVRTTNLPGPNLSPTIQRIANMLDHQSPAVQHAAEKIVKVVIETISTTKRDNSHRLAAESRASYRKTPEE